jgi:hypothetical protein
MTSPNYDIDSNPFYIIENDDDPFANFATVIFATAEDHDFAYGVTSASKYKSNTSCLSLINQFWGTSASSPVKPKPTLNLANSRLFRRRAEALVVKAPLAPAVTTVTAVPAVPTVPALINFEDNFANSSLAKRRKKAAAEKAAADLATITIASS